MEDLLKRAKELVIEHNAGSVSLLQIKMGIGYNQACELMAQLEKEGVVGPARGSRIREVLVKIPETNAIPNGISLEKLGKLLMFSDRYEISIHFWPEIIAVFISKGGVSLKDFGGDFDFAIDSSIEYLNRINGIQA